MQSHLPRDADTLLPELIGRLRGERGGEVNALLPGAADADPDGFAIAVVAIDGQTAQAGDHDHRLTLQSMSKPFIYGLALDRLGRDAVHRKVSVEPTGEAFNSIIELEEDHLPYNPMVNSGAIAMSALLHHADPDRSADWTMEMFGAYLGRTAEMHPEVRDAGLGAGHRNRAIAHLLRHFEVIGDDIEGALQLYARQCAVTASTTELALMAATLANGGINPATGQRAVERGHLRDILTLMFTCGMYDTSGAWAYTVGLPAKSGVSGGVLAVVPGRMGIAVYSPRLDAHGHSVRGVAAFKALSAAWDVGLFAA